MFTGIVEELGKIQKITSDKVFIECKTVLEGTKIGDSIAVNGVCLTVVEINSNGFAADVSPQTYKVTALNTLHAGDFVNLERAMKADGRFGGHIVSGHIDGKGKLIRKTTAKDFYEFEFELDDELAKYTIEKGSISINGISLTIAGAGVNKIKLAIIPHTLGNTNLKFLKSGDIVNIEVDMVAKYIENFLLTRDNRTGITMELLQTNGFI